MNASAFTTVRTTQTAMEAELLISVLRQAGLHPVELNTAGQYSLPGADIEYEVRVPAEEAAQALEVLRAREPNPE